MSKIIVETNNPVWQKQKLVIYVTDQGISLKRLVQIDEQLNDNYQVVQVSADSLLTHTTNTTTLADIEQLSNTISVVTIGQTQYYIETEYFFSKQNLDLFWHTGSVIFLSMLKHEFATTPFGMLAKGNIQSVLDNTAFSHLTAIQYSDYSYRSSMYNDMIWIYCLENESIADSMMLFRVGKADNIITNVNIDDVSSIDDIESIHNNNLLTAVIDGPDTIKPDETVQLNVELRRNNMPVQVNCSLQIEPVNGYVPNRRVQIVDGKGSFYVNALQLKQNDKLRVKINNRTYTSLAEKIIDVVS